MNSFNVHFTEVWIVLLCLALAAVVLTLGAGIMLAWKQRPIERDPVQEEKVHKRLSQIAQASSAQPKKSA